MHTIESKVHFTTPSYIYFKCGEGLNRVTGLRTREERRSIGSSGAND